ncbi:hypothetical protein D3C85_1043070 [compost metagenome]
MGAFAVETRRIARRSRVLDLEQFAGVVERPAVEWAGIGRFVAGLVSAQHRTAVTAGVDEGIQLAVLVARNEDRLAAHGGGVEIVFVRNLALVGEVQPVAFEDVLHLEIEQARVGKHLPLAAEEALFFVVFEQGVKVFGSQGHGRRLHCFYSGRLMLGRVAARQYPLGADRYPFCARRTNGLASVGPIVPMLPAWERSINEDAINAGA